ncbi:hypothetical protein ABZ897_51095 [Nonomuraea sp. NPDC046802]|uniref:hypothetical protein n=1 Tax=Nonomuraea sp. NPDC046802 TaxID=3154919 RepID=UPI00340D6733
MITIRHNHEDGTLVYGTSKGDGVFEIIEKWENGGFRFFPSLRMLGLRNSRDRGADRWTINAAAKALREAGSRCRPSTPTSSRPLRTWPTTWR